MNPRARIRCGHFQQVLYAVLQASRTGGFGLGIGVARSDDLEVLHQSGADIVV
jgi:hypothetical protein